MTAICRGDIELFSAARLEQVFAACFAARYHTRLQGGAAEPLYQPAATTGACHTLCYREDFFASALHEVAHWCIAGARRRLQVDFGYWYAPDGRSAEQQAAFEQVEVKPQALECFFARACAYPFRISSDNIEAGDTCSDDSAFGSAVCRQCLTYQQLGLPDRGLLFFQALAREFNTETDPAQLCFQREAFR